MRKNLKQYNVISNEGFMYQYYDNNMEKQVQYAIPGEGVEVYESGKSVVVDVLMKGGRVPTLNLAHTVELAIKRGILEEVVR